MDDEKRALLHEAIMLKGKLDFFEKKYKETKAALRMLMEEDGDAFLDTEDGRAFYKSGSATMLTDDGATIARLLHKDELVDLIAGKKLTKGDANFLLTVTTGRNISKLLTEVPSRSFTAEKARTKAEKARMQAAIDAEAEEAMKDLRERVNRFRKRLGLGRSERLGEPKGRAAAYSGKGRPRKGGKPAKKKAAKAKKK